MATLIKKGKKSGNANGEAAHAPEPVAQAPEPAPHAPEPEVHAQAHSTALVDTRKPPQPPGPPVDTTPWLSYAPSTGDTYDGPLPPNFPRSYGSATPYDVGRHLRAAVGRRTTSSCRTGTSPPSRRPRRSRRPALPGCCSGC